MQTVLVDQLVGQTVGAYRVERLLAHSKLSAVYLARQNSSQEPVALTTFIIPEQFSPGARERFLARFRQDAEVLVALRHRRLLPVYAYGEQYGYPYLVTPYMMHGSLADVLKQRGRYTPAEVLHMLEQIAPGIDYAHSQGVVHGALKPANIVFDERQNMLVAGFGLSHILQLSGIVASDKPYAHLLNITEGMLSAPEYFAPEVVKGQAMDARSDMYALGVVLFELLHGQPPFTGGTPLEVAAQHLQQPIPSLHSLHPDIPIALELVVKHALARKPQERFQRISDLAEAFAQVCRGANSTQPIEGIVPAQSNNTAPLRDGEGYTTLEREAMKGWQLKPPVVTGKSPAVRPLPESEKMAAVEKTGQANSWQLTPPIITGKLSVVRESDPPPLASTGTCMPAASAPIPAKAQPLPAQPSQLYAPTPRPASAPFTPGAQPGAPGRQDASVSPWWSHVSPGNTSASVPSVPPTHRPLAESASLRLPPPPVPPSAAFLAEAVPLQAPKRRRSPDKGRRRVVTMLATGGVVAAGLLAFGGFELKHLMHNGAQAQATTGNTGTAQQPTNNKTTTPAPKKTPTTGNKGTTANTDGHVIGTTKLALNTAMAFTNPLNNQEDLLVHLPNNSFVAYDRACTHQQVPVNYDPASQKFICPAHGSIFDPANNGAVVQGPATRPLPAVTIKVNTDGTIAVV